MEYYDIGEAFKKIEEELMASMIRNLKHHRAEEIEEGFEWSQWQVEQLSALEEYRRRNKKQFSGQFQEINDSIDTLIQLARQQGGMDQEIKILNAIKRGYRPSNPKASAEIMGEFFKVNDRKLNALVEATQNDFKKAEVAMLRMANDKYRKIIYNAQVYANAGGTTYEQAVDMATKDFIRAGINCIEYKNGSRHTMSDYADMCIRTATKRAYLTGEGEKRMEWGESLVIVNKRNAACPKCMKFCGVVLIDDVWSGGKPDGRHQLMSNAIEKGLYHPRCKDIHTTYFPGISTMPDKLSNEEKEKIVDDYNQEQKQNYYERQAEQQERIAKYSLDSDNKKNHDSRYDNWNDKIDCISHEQLAKYEDEFMKLTEGYSYDDFINDFDSIEDGFDGCGEEEIEKAKGISEKIEYLRCKLNIGNENKKNRIRTKKESIEILESLGIDFANNSYVTVSDELLSKYADFISNFEQSHVGYFNRNEFGLQRIEFVDKIKQHQFATGMYKSDGKRNGIFIRPSSIRKKQAIDMSLSDDFEIHQLAHEYGHYIDETLEKNFGQYSENTAGNILRRAILRYYDGDIWKQVKDLKDCLSAYGSTDHQEAFAEAFAEAYTCENPRMFARIFKEELENVIGINVKKTSLENIVESSTIKLRINLFDKQDQLYLDAFSVDEIPGFSDICMHGSPTSVQNMINGKIENMNAKEFAEFLRTSTNYNGEDIRLASCATGKGDNSFAQQLSKELGVRVMAPDDDLYYLPNEGTMFVGSPYTNTGTWRIFNNGVEE